MVASCGVEVVSRVEDAVRKLMTGRVGHEFDHIERVVGMARRFAREEGADEEIVVLASLLHDADDYKYFGEESAKNLTNARRIMAGAGVPNELQSEVLGIISTMGYSKYLAGIRPTTLEGKIVSDADMCDALGAYMVVRMVEAEAVHGRLFRIPEQFPKLDLEPNEYRGQWKAATESLVVNHVFQKAFRLKSLMMTDAGRKEAAPRHEFLADFFRRLFEEAGELEWVRFLDDFLAREYGVE